MFFGKSTSLRSLSNSENILGFSKVVTTSKTQNISKFVKVRRMLKNIPLVYDREAFVALKQKIVSYRKSTLFVKNNINSGESTLFKAVSDKYELAYSLFGKRTITIFFKNIIERTTMFNNSKLKISIVVKKYFTFAAATKYFNFFFKISKNSVGRRVWKTIAGQIFISLARAKYVNDSDRLGCLEFPNYFFNKGEFPEGVDSDSDTESSETEIDDRPFLEEGDDGTDADRNALRELKNAMLSDYFFIKTIRTLLRGAKALPAETPTNLGVLTWNSNRFGFGNFSIANSLSTMSSFFSKNVFRSHERSVTALGYFNGRSKNFGSFYKASAVLLAQSWGNLGTHVKNDFYKNAFYLNYTFNRYSVYAELAEKDICDFYAQTVTAASLQSFASQSEKYESFAKPILISKTYISWLRAGYVILNDFGNYDSRINLIATAPQNYNMSPFSKVFGHPFHLVNPSVLPLTLSFVFFTLIQDVLSSFCLEMWYSSSFSVLAHATMIGLFFSVILSWLFEVFSEEQAGCHTLEVQSGFKYAVLLFILSELMLFISFFWAYFHFSLNSNSFTGGTYAARGIVPFYATRIPFLNTLLLLSSGLSLTIAHTLVVESDKLTKAAIWLDSLALKLGTEWDNLCNEINTGYIINPGFGHPLEYLLVAFQIYQKRSQQVSVKVDISKKKGLSLTKLGSDNKESCVDKVGRVSNDFQVNLPKSFLINFKFDEKNIVWQPNYWILDTVLKGFVFLIFQAYEYTSCMFSMNDSVYGAVFFSLTGLHGIHVYLGVMFLLFGLLVNLKKNMSKSYFKSEEEYDSCVDKFNSRGVFLKSSMNSKIWTHRVAFDGAAWYWHFVDVVWFFVFVFVYVWGYATTPYVGTSN